MDTHPQAALRFAFPLEGAQRPRGTLWALALRLMAPYASLEK